MFQPGEQVLYGIHGVCTILGIESRKIDRKMLDYYVLSPTDQPGARFYIPTQNQMAVAKLRPIMTEDELCALLASSKNSESVWIDDENRRKQRYRELITSGDRAALLQMVHALHKHKQEQGELGKHLHLSDENFLRDAEKLLNSEFSFVLNIPQEQVPGYVKKNISEE